MKDDKCVGVFSQRQRQLEAHESTKRGRRAVSNFDVPLVPAVILASTVVGVWSAGYGEHVGDFDGNNDRLFIGGSEYLWVKLSS